MKVLNVAEKNDAAKNIANILSRGSASRKDSPSVFNKIYEFNYNLPEYGPCRMQFTSVAGHLLSIDFDNHHRGWRNCDPIDLFDAPVISFCDKKMEPVKNNLLNLTRFADILIIWTDCDREGEGIGFEVIGVCKSVKPSLTVLRARFSEITHRAVSNALSNLVEPDKKAADAVAVRSELDLRIGAAFTRFQTVYLQNKLTLEGVISYGSCQFPTLGFVVERYKQREEFVSSPFYYIDISHKKERISPSFTWERVRVFDQDACLALYSKTLEQPYGTVLSMDGKRKTKWRPTPMDTIQLEKLSSSRLKINAKETMKIAEKLYTQGFISYPRTETNIFPNNLNLPQYVEAQCQNSQWGDFARNLLMNGLYPRNGTKSDQAHPPIHPTKYTDSLNGNDKRVYELIVRHFLACLSKDAVGYETTVRVDVNGEKFKASGLIVQERNYLEVYPYDKWYGSELPKYVQGEILALDEIQMKEGATTPPPLLTESDLIALMEKHGIGTDATHADHIETIKARKYAEVTHDRRFKPLPLGFGLIEGYSAIQQEMTRPFLRAGLERDLQSICDGMKDPRTVLSEQIKLYKCYFREVINRKLALESSVRQKMARQA
ncbi:DNA topoisomerase 3-alpha [Halotydeus destructor]|nr:DNA topoisomerase 3-alpha [Halotydeus destructor]